MGRFLKQTLVKVALVGVQPEVANRLTDRLVGRREDDAGTFEVTPYQDIRGCRTAIENGKVNAVCIAFQKFRAPDFVAFVGDVRVTHPLVPICLVGTSKDLAEMQGFHEEWRSRLSHYYKLALDLPESEFEENAGLLRDLLVADGVKTRALGHYDTTPGQIIKIKHAAPFGFWIMATITLLAAVLGAALGPVITYYLSMLKK